ncbi:MAG TPA: LysR family transcriptional regulator, partial [Kiloniellaceae bacterium]|nr:LysR family transcriptional regulator [Kiloniellaceae bacterium]
MNEPAAITGPVRLVDLDSSLLRSFVAVVDAGGLTAASARLGLTQSGVSVRLRRLEDRLGLRVLSRSSRSLELTPEGELL